MKMKRSTKIREANAAEDSKVLQEFLQENNEEEDEGAEGE